MKKIIALFLAFVFAFVKLSAASDTFVDYQNFNHGYCPTCNCYPCRCSLNAGYYPGAPGAVPVNAPCDGPACSAPSCQAPCQPPCDPCDPCCAPICGTECGVSICAIAVAVAALVTAAAIILSSSNSH